MTLHIPWISILGKRDVFMSALFQITTYLGIDMKNNQQLLFLCL
jgi:hypothetical protein